MTTETAAATRVQANRRQRSSTPRNAELGALRQPAAVVASANPWYLGRCCLPRWPCRCGRSRRCCATVFDGSSAWPRAIALYLFAGLVWQFILVLLRLHPENRAVFVGRC